MDQALAISALAISFLTFIGMVYVGAFKIAKIESRVDIVWGFVMRQGLSSGILGGIMEKNSPLQLSVRVLNRHRGLVERAKTWYAHTKPNISDLELFIEIEKEFNIELNEMCIKERVLPGGCTAALMFMLRPEAEIFRKFNQDEERSNNS